MKKLFVGAIIVGLVASAYFVFKNKKKENVSSQPQRDYSKPSPEAEKPIVPDDSGGIKEMYEAKESSAQSVYERHTEAASVMADAFKNIMESVDPIGNDDASVDAVIDTKDVETIQELDSLSDELDELLK